MSPQCIPGGDWDTKGCSRETSRKKDKRKGNEAFDPAETVLEMSVRSVGAFRKMDSRFPESMKVKLRLLLSPVKTGDSKRKILSEYRAGFKSDH